MSDLSVSQHLLLKELVYQLHLQREGLSVILKILELKDIILQKVLHKMVSVLLKILELMVLILQKILEIKGSVLLKILDKGAIIQLKVACLNKELILQMELIKAHLTEHSLLL